MKRECVITVRLSAKEREVLRVEAEKSGQGISELVREMVFSVLRTSKDTDEHQE